MGQELIGALRVTLGLDSAKFEDGLKKSRARAAADASAIQKSFTGARTALTGFTAVLGGAALVEASRRALDYASSLGEVAQQLGVTTKDLQVYRYAGTQVGIAQEDMDKSLAKLTRTIGEAKAGSKAQATTFRELGIAIQDANGRVYTAGEVIPKLADALARIKDPATRARIETELFGKAGQKLDTLLAGGSVAINKLRDDAQRLGVVLSDKIINQADDAADKLGRMKEVLQAKLAGVVAENANAIVSLGDAFGYAAVKGGEFVQTMRGFDRLKKDEGGSAYFTSSGWSWSRMLQASTPEGYAKLRGDELNSAKAELAAAEKRLPPKMDPTARAAQLKSYTDAVQTARWRWVTALNDPEYKAAIAKPPSTGKLAKDGALPTASGGGGKSRGPTAADRAENYAEQNSRLLSEQLGLQEDITSDVRARARMEHDRLDTERAAYEFDLDTKVKAGQLNAANAERLKVVAARNAELKHTAVNWRLDDELTRQETELRRDSLNNQVERLSSEAKLARTAGERREIELKILDAQFEIYRLEQQAIKDRHSSTDAERVQAQGKLDALPGLKSAATRSVYAGTMGPLAAYFDSLPRSADEVNEAFEHIAANGIADMVDGLAEAGANVLQLKGFAGQLFNQLIADVIRLNLQQGLSGGGGILGALGGLFGLGSRSSFANGTLAANSAFLGAFKAGPIPGLAGLPGFAGGGSFRVNGNSGIDTNVLALNGVPVARVNTGERITVDPQSAQSGGGVSVVQVLPSEYFDVVVDRRAAAVAGPMVMRGAAGASSHAQAEIGARARRRIPSRFY